ncbi:MAG: alpha/beta hydrolase fold domain-containing protein [Gammaproteobacteria bacterium]|nr:alpha/beta hydrolase fold domain-containing protein [Gammaproteobacteria bacterium]
MTNSSTSDQKSEIEALVEMIKANPFPEPLPDARAAMDSLGTPVTDDVKMEAIELGGVSCQILLPATADDERVIVYLHGGGYVLGSLQSHAGLASEIGKAAACRVLQVDYRLAPEHQFPAPIEDTCSVYNALLAGGTQAEKIIFAGDSAGGGLVIASIAALKESGSALPGAAICLSPWLDLEFTGESVESCKEVDPIIDTEVLSKMVSAYMAEQDPAQDKASPLHVDLQGFPPLLIQVGECEILLSDSERLAENAKEAKLDVVLDKWPEMIHVWQLFYPHLSEGRSAIAKIGDFIREKVN